MRVALFFKKYDPIADFVPESDEQFEKHKIFWLSKITKDEVARFIVVRKEFFEMQTKLKGLVDEAFERETADETAKKRRQHV